MHPMSWNKHSRQIYTFIIFLNDFTMVKFSVPVYMYGMKNSAYTVSNCAVLTCNDE